MVAYTTAKSLYQVANSSYVGTWDVPENSNWGVVDAALGQITTIQLNNTPVTLSQAQMQCAQIIFSSSAAPGGVLTGSVVITFPTVGPVPAVLTGPYIIQNLCGNSSLFTVTLQTTMAGGQAVACKPGEPFDVINDGINFKFKNMGHIGSYWDYGGSSVPNWVTACTIPPYLNCDGTSFSSATYPTLTSITGTVLPDYRGRFPAYLNQGTTRLTTAAFGIDGNTLFANGTGLTTLSSVNVPLVPIQDPGHFHSYGQNNLLGSGANSIFGGPLGSGTVTTNSFTGITAGNSSPTAFGTAPPALVGGIRMIRAA